MTGDGLFFPHGICQVRAMCWAYKQVLKACWDDLVLPCRASHLKLCMCAVGGLYGKSEMHRRKENKVHVSMYSTVQWEFSCSCGLSKCRRPPSCKCSWATKVLSPASCTIEVRYDEEQPKSSQDAKLGKYNRWLGPGNTGFWCCFRDCDQIHKLAASKAYLATDAAKSVFGNTKWNKKIRDETILPLQVQEARDADRWRPFITSQNWLRGWGCPIDQKRYQIIQMLTQSSSIYNVQSWVKWLTYNSTSCIRSKVYTLPLALYM